MSESQDVLRIVVDEVQGVPRIQLIGELDIASAGRLGRTFRDVLEAHPSQIVVDLADLRFIDSSGVRTFVMDLARPAQELRIQVRARNARPAVYRTFDLTGLATTLQISPAA